jgi:hypothetical protein
MVVEGEAGEDEEEADAGAAWAVEPNVQSEGEGAGYEKAGDYGVAPAAVGAGHVGFGRAEAEQGDDGQAVENPSCKNK